MCFIFHNRMNYGIRRIKKTPPLLFACFKLKTIKMVGGVFYIITLVTTAQNPKYGGFAISGNPNSSGYSTLTKYKPQAGAVIPA